MIKAPEAIIEDGKVVNHEELKRYWSDWRFRQDRIQRGMFQDLREQEAPEPLPDAPQREQINITYQIDAKSTPAFKELQDEIRFLEGRMTKYFEGKKKSKSKENAPF